MRAAALAAILLSLPLAAACQRTGPPPPVTTVGNAPGSAGGAFIVQRGDTAYTLARRYNVPLRDLIEANRLVPPYKLEVGQRLILPASRQYVVQRGDSLTSVSRMFSVELTELSRLNGISPPYAIQAGQTLRLPGAGEGRPIDLATTAPASDAVPVSGDAVPPGTAAPSPKVTRGAVQVSELPPPPSAVAAPRSSAEAPPSSGTVASDAPKTLRPPSARPVQADAAPPVETVPAPPPQEVAAPRDEAAPPPRGATRFLWPVKGRVISSFGTKPDGMNNDGINIAAPKGAPVVAADNGVVAYAGNELRGFGNLLLIKHDGGWITAYAHLDRMDVERGVRVKRGERIGTVGQTGSVNAPQLHFELRKGSAVVDPRDQMEQPEPRLSEGASPAGRQGPG